MKRLLVLLSFAAMIAAFLFVVIGSAYAGPVIHPPQTVSPAHPEWPPPLPARICYYDLSIRIHRIGTILPERGAEPVCLVAGEGHPYAPLYGMAMPYQGGAGWMIRFTFFPDDKKGDPQYGSLEVDTVNHTITAVNGEKLADPYDYYSCPGTTGGKQ